MHHIIRITHTPRDPYWFQEEIKIVSDFARQSCRGELFGNSSEGKRAPTNIHHVKKATQERVARPLVQRGGGKKRLATYKESVSLSDFVVL